MTQQELFVKAIKMNPKKIEAYIALGRSLPLGGTIEMDKDTTLTQYDLYRKALELNEKE